MNSLARYAAFLGPSSGYIAILIAPDFTSVLDGRIRDDLQHFSGSLFAGVVWSAVIVIVGVAMEGPEILHELWPRTFTFFATGSEQRILTVRRWLKLIGFAGWILVVMGVAGEGIFETFQNRAEGQLQAFNDVLLADTQRNAGNAKESAIEGAIAASRANSESEKAASSSASAIILAQKARSEADSYAEQISSAKSEAADAVSRLAEAEQKLADASQREAKAEEQLKRLKMPRSLVSTNNLIAAIKLFKGTEYTFEVAQDDEAIQLTKDIGRVLEDAGWIRKQPAQHNIGLTFLNVFSEDPKDSVASCIRTGIEVSLRATESLESLRSRPERFLPRRVQAALALRAALAPSVSPPDDLNVKAQVGVDKEPGEGPIIICVGKKP